MDSSTLKHTIIIDTGDTSRDGHGQSDSTTFACNRSAADVRRLYGNAVKQYGINIVDECEEYECNTLSDEFVAKFNEVFKDQPEILKLIEDAGYGENRIDLDTHVEIYWEIARLSDPELVWKEESTHNNTIDVGGYGYYC
jgi:hypothetical protein